MLRKRMEEFREENLKFYEAWGEQAARKSRLLQWSEHKFRETMSELVEENTRIYEKMFGESTRQCRRKALQQFNDQCSYCRWLMPWNNAANFDSANIYCLKQVQEREETVIPEEVIQEMLVTWAENELDRTPLVAWTASLLAVVIGVAVRILK
jgi:hypothetical protein